MPVPVDSCWCSFVRALVVSHSANKRARARARMRVYLTLGLLAQQTSEQREKTGTCVTMSLFTCSMTLACRYCGSSETVLFPCSTNKTAFAFSGPPARPCPCRASPTHRAK